ncbi:MAG: hypothetical protein A2504_08965 [Bdellovibrionales bacterium RIFOXYD12_FULL_39_22]|nr:MAG: hypothetical protein A2385_13480 [Bdellovibrionales bacterium RIFOXYB1_FULL_39_21]OFZ40899.1 MAG: hypothetical protein A2485_16265 [Bdellovibrionales bacterium RIFOXYC12_FULL_39_17]OFZ44757.1 MAG: hypothetical protein A2404_10855 [Bdellovibrionales bacterium RIFOXYC1_FULL_39_130]OFZ74208.1 MAG: hypothetical protein A2560_03520 [Bdellovibrionales bacterium RIFOXYD1_FULL_39_84]OFZ92088.1 MAG: hypothetical protein A2504_08965 [Bdellovibrionales bacterium RIFOXYD12_FULL_39_22]HLE10592.1 hy
MSEKKNNFNRRKTLLINPKFQLSVIRQFFVLLFTVFFTLALIFIWQYSPLMTEVYTLGLDENHPFMIAFEKFQFMMMIVFICGGIFSISMFYLAALVISNRVAGPLYHICNHLKDLREEMATTPLTAGSSSTFKHINLRKKDYFFEVAEEINRFFDAVEKKSAKGSTASTEEKNIPPS